MLRALYKQQPADFIVQEILGSPLTGEGEHVYFYVEKVGCNTQGVARKLASFYNLVEHEVGFAGRKDRHAVTRQWFSVPLRQAPTANIEPAAQSSIMPQTTEREPRSLWPWSEPDVLNQPGTSVRCLNAVRHVRKLRIGQLSGNLFEIRLQITPSDANQKGIDIAKLQAELSKPFPNSFGAQRFGANNLDQALAWLEARQRSHAQGDGAKRRAPRKHYKQRKQQKNKGWHLSVLRSFLFNEVLNARVAAGTFATVLDGDVMQAGFPTGPLWGRGYSAATAQALEVEHKALAAHQWVCDGLEYAGVDQGRRPLAVKPQSVWVCLETPDVLRLKLALPAGAYATSLLAYHFDLQPLAEGAEVRVNELV